MSETMKCDFCETTAQRRMRHAAPEGWFYLEAMVEDAAVIIYACSERCRDSAWKHGPGDLREGLQDEEGKQLLVSAPEYLGEYIPSKEIIEKPYERPYTPMFQGEFEGLTDEQARTKICEDYETTRAEVDRFDLVYLKQSYESYEGDSVFVLRERATGDWYHNAGGHCSCRGFEGQFDPGKVSVEWLQATGFGGVILPSKS